MIMFPYYCLLVCFHYQPACFLIIVCYYPPSLMVNFDPTRHDPNSMGVSPGAGPGFEPFACCLLRATAGNDWMSTLAGRQATPFWSAEGLATIVRADLIESITDALPGILWESHRMHSGIISGKLHFMWCRQRH